MKRSIRFRTLSCYWEMAAIHAERGVIGRWLLFGRVLLGDGCYSDGCCWEICCYYFIRRGVIGILTAIRRGVLGNWLIFGGVLMGDWLLFGGVLMGDWLLFGRVLLWDWLLFGRVLLWDWLLFRGMLLWELDKVNAFIYLNVNGHITEQDHSEWDEGEHSEVNPVVYFFKETFILLINVGTLLNFCFVFWTT